MMLRYDLIIIGGGLVGAGLAAALQHLDLRIALIDARVPNNNDPRLLALNAGSCQFLQNLGLWSKLSDQAASIMQVHVSYQGHFGSVRLTHKDAELPFLGHVIPAFHIESALNQLLETLPNVTLYRPAKLESISQQDGVARLTVTTTAGEKTLQASLVVGADGTESTVREQLAINTSSVDYKQSALVTRTQLNRSHHHIAYERFNSKGAIAMLPLIGNECATIWTADNHTISHLLQIPETEFIQELQTHFGYRLGRFLGIAKRHIYPLRMVQAEKSVQGCVVLLGNSAHTLSPIAAQGFNLALYEVATFVDAITRHCERGETNQHHNELSLCSPNDNIFTELDLQKIITQTEKQQSISVGTSHRLTKFFGKQHAFSSVAVQLGMVGLDILTPVKKQFLANMMGRKGRIPKLLLNTKDL